jgi:uncharacterized protein
LTRCWAGGGVVALALALAACGNDTAAVPASAPKTVADYFPISVGGKAARMQLAVRPAEMQRGLMERRDLGPDDGMLFVYDRPQQMHFWMRNTPTPLDIGFFDARGVLQEVYPLHPYDETTVSSRGTAVQFALEMHQGWYRRNGLKPGAQLDLEALAAALKERGFNPDRYLQP